MPKRALRYLTYGLLGGVAALSFALPGTITVPAIHAAGGTGARLTGIVRDFPVTHPDFNVVPADGAGHYAGNVATLLGDDGRPLQVHGVSNFTIEFGKIVPGIPYAARATVLGAEITSGMDPMPVTIQAATDTETFEPFGDSTDPVAATVNDGANPREYVFSLTNVYSAETPIAITATSWAEGASAAQFGHDTVLGGESGDADSRQLATQVTLPTSGTVTSITAYVKESNGVVYGLYTDSGGEPGTLLAETSSADSPAGWSWFTRLITPTWVPAGTYWLAISQDESNQKIRCDSGGGQTRRNNNDAENYGFQATWSGTTSSSTKRLSIYAKYAPDAGSYTPHMTVNSGDDSPYVIVLKDGDPVPAIPGFADQSTIADFVEPYVDLDTALITLADNQAIYLFELGTTDLTSPSADFQDLVVMLTLATDPVYFFASGSSADGLEPVGFKVDAQWTDSGGRNIAPHLYTPAAGDSAGVSGAVSSGGVLSPASFYEWFRDFIGTNQSITHDITLVDDGFGVYEFDSDYFYPIDGRLYGNQGTSHNHYFTYAVSGVFTYDDTAGQFFEFRGGDGAWLYVDEKLAIDLGGVQTGVPQIIELDRLDLTDGQTCEMRLFYANRNPSGSDFRLRTNILLGEGAKLGSVTALFD